MMTELAGVSPIVSLASQAQERANGVGFSLRRCLTDGSEFVMRPDQAVTSRCPRCGDQGYEYRYLEWVDNELRDVPKVGISNQGKASDARGKWANLLIKRKSRPVNPIAKAIMFGLVVFTVAGAAGALLSILFTILIRP